MSCEIHSFVHVSMHVRPIARAEVAPTCTPAVAVDESRTIWLQTIVTSGGTQSKKERKSKQEPYR